MTEAQEHTQASRMVASRESADRHRHPHSDDHVGATVVVAVRRFLGL